LESTLLPEEETWVDAVIQKSPWTWHTTGKYPHPVIKCPEMFMQMSECTPSRDATLSFIKILKTSFLLQVQASSLMNASRNAEERANSLQDSIRFQYSP
jgi:hypothetical protein